MRHVGPISEVPPPDADPRPSVISKFHSRVCFDRAQLLAICKPPISSTTNRTATEVGRSTDGWRIFSIKSRLSAPSPPGAQLATHLPNRSTSVVSLAAELSVRGALSSIDLEISGDLGEFRVKFRNVSYRFECAAVPPPDDLMTRHIEARWPRRARTGRVSLATRTRGFVRRPRAAVSA